jgi:hypothetical protein
MAGLETEYVRLGELMSATLIPRPVAVVCEHAIGILENLAPSGHQSHYYLSFTLSWSRQGLPSASEKLRVLT